MYKPKPGDEWPKCGGDPYSRVACARRVAGRCTAKFCNFSHRRECIDAARAKRGGSKAKKEKKVTFSKRPIGRKGELVIGARPSGPTPAIARVSNVRRRATRARLANVSRNVRGARVEMKNGNGDKATPNEAHARRLLFFGPSAQRDAPTVTRRATV